MLVGFHLYGLGGMTAEQLAELIRSHIIIENPSYATNMANVLSAGYELNILCPNLNDESALDTYNVPYKVIDIDESETTSVTIFNAVDFKVELTYKNAKDVVVLQPSEFITIDYSDLWEFKEYQKAGLIRVFTGSLSDRYFTDEYSLEFA